MKNNIYTKEYKKLTAKLIKARQDSLLTQKDVAKLIKKTQSYISKNEAGQKKIDIIEMKLLARIYKKNVLYFIK